jgi:hypothetical protein
MVKPKNTPPVLSTKQLRELRLAEMDALYRKQLEVLRALIKTGRINIDRLRHR